MLAIHEEGKLDDEQQEALAYAEQLHAEAEALEQEANMEQEMQREAEEFAADGLEYAAQIHAEAEALEKEVEVYKKQQTQDAPQDEQLLNLRENQELRGPNSQADQDENKPKTNSSASQNDNSSKVNRSNISSKVASSSKPPSNNWLLPPEAANDPEYQLPLGSAQGDDSVPK